MVIRVGPRINKTQFLFSKSFHGVFFIYFIYLFILDSGSPLLHGLFSSCREKRLLSSSGTQASHCCGFSCCKTGRRLCGLQQSWHEGSVVAAYGLQITGSVAVAHRAYLFHDIWDPLRPGIKPMFPALAGRFFTTELPGKPQSFLLPSDFLWGFTSTQYSILPLCLCSFSFLNS